MKTNLFDRHVVCLLLSIFIFSCQEPGIDPIVSLNTADLSYQVRADDVESLTKAAVYTAMDSKSRRLDNIRVSEVIVIPDEIGNPSLYVSKFDSIGYLILSASKKEAPILGYSFESNFNMESLTGGMREWFLDRVYRIQSLNKDDDYQVPEEINLKWKTLYDQNVLANSRQHPEGGIYQIVEIEILEEYGPLLSTRWAQRSPYNALVPLNCPSHDSGKAPTGCVATAIAQIARYHEYPSNKYNWQIMPDWPTTIEDIDAANLEIARLMRDVGVWVGMNYGCGESSAGTGDIVNVFKNKFNYLSGGIHEARSLEEAEPLVKADLKKGLPVIMAGHEHYTTWSWLFWEETFYQDGHVWVCDGYAKDRVRMINHNNKQFYFFLYEFYHMNWGWGYSGMGSADNNGWFSFEDIELNNGVNFQYNRRYITNIRPY
ncbi:C10 family peptidase [Reichenbachiella sp. MSK19-1]|uniref:C10 family peptidase n=1 Tax=Reichenbachiella sp. MSK19-1 TaxID=1897631 RepID=UPI000E6B8028|nr:C10 family peptidase [Reichenbachiella sp. MSK19-1]RJE73036.1 hypothetical protein BGP76_03575 [Reichenbachiella sp. MSK19-1]